MELSENLTRRQKLILAIQGGHDAVVRFVRDLGAELRADAGGADGLAVHPLTARLLVAHLAAHKLRTVRAVVAWRQGMGGAGDLAASAMPGDTAGEAADSGLFRDTPWSEVSELFLEAQRQALEMILALNEADLERVGELSWMQRRPLWRVIYASCVAHPFEHLAGYWIEGSQAEQATRLRQEEARLALALDDTPAWQGAAQYNLACHYTLVRALDQAVDELRLAFEHYPELASYSRRDADLAALQGQAGYAELVGEVEARLRSGVRLDRRRLEAVLGKVLERLAQGGRKVEFRLVGTGAALLHGVQLPAADVDLLARDRRGVDIFAAALAGFPCSRPPQYLDGAMQYFAEFQVDGVAVQISTVEAEEESDTLECVGRGPWTHYTILRCRGYVAPAVALELRLLSELGRGREDRVKPLLDFMKEQGCDLALLRRGMLEARLPEAQQRQVMTRLLGG